MTSAVIMYRTIRTN